MATVTTDPVHADGTPAACIVSSMTLGLGGANDTGAPAAGADWGDTVAEAMAGAEETLSDARAGSADFCTMEFN